MKTKLIFVAVSSLFGLMSAFEGIASTIIFLLLLFGLWVIKKINPKFIVILLLFYTLYFMIGYFTISTSHSTLSPLQTQFFIQFTDEINIDGDRFKAIVVNVEKKEKLVLTYKIPTQIVKKELENKLLIENICPVTGNLQTPAVPRNQNAFNYKDYLMQKQIYWELQITNWDFSNCKQSSYSLLDRIKILRLKGISQIERNFPKELSPLAAALIFGTRELLSEETLTAYQRLGVIHLISISGLHVALLINFIFYLGIKLGAVREKLSKILIFCLPVYAIVTGATPSVNRAVIMAMLILIFTNHFSLKLTSIDGLSISLLFLITINPYVIYHIGFQLSFIVTLALLLSTSILSTYTSSVGKMALISYISQVSALPFLLYYFFEIPLLSIMANFIFIPLFSFIFLPGVLLLFLIQFISTDGFHFLAFFLTLLADHSNCLAEYISEFSWTRFITGRPSNPLIFFYIGSIIFSFILWEKEQRLRLHLLFPWLVLFVQLLLPFVNSEGEVTFIDVGQGDSILIKLPNNQGNYLIDTGGKIPFKVPDWKQRKNSFDVGKDVLIPFLKAKGISQLDLLILTHGDMDHIGSSLVLLKEVKVKKILLPSTMVKSPLEKEIVKEANKLNIEVLYVSEGVNWEVRRNKFMIISPPHHFIGERNEGSIVIYSKIGGKKWLFTGDLGIEGERSILKKFPNLKVDVLKVGHHGSRNSTYEAFIKQIKPKYSIISVGEKNGFGHPHMEVLKILEEEGSKIIRTDNSGGISYYFEGERGTFSSVLP
ncbi:DNA internalization-related competence protein ComEC/Rec2 [Neobacillus sp. D3-1R]|uniref:DNA internalization-related competence protein ComEC/Rec2 n=1 Tax=Neobacillus sp. D3-1R TaxID=3445778 RepID=UPI003F9FABC5